MPATAEGLRVSVGLFAATLVRILSRKARVAANRVRGLRLPGFAAKLAVTTLLAFLLMSGIESNPGPTTPTASGQPEEEGNDATSNQPVLRELLTQMKTLTQAVSRLENAQTDNTAQLTSRLDTVDVKLSTRLNEIADDQTVLKHDVSALYEHLEQMKSSHEHFQSHIDKLEDKIDELENQSRRSNVLFDGVPPSTDETWDDCENKVLDIIRRKMKIPQDVLIERAHRLGKAIIVRFQSYKDRELVLSRARELKGSSIFVHGDVSDRVRQKQRGLMSLMKTMRSDGKRAVIRHDKLRSEEGTFTFDINQQEIVKVDDRRLPPWEHRHQRQPPRPGRQYAPDHNRNSDSGTQGGRADHGATMNRKDDHYHRNVDVNADQNQGEVDDDHHPRSGLGLRGFPPLRSRSREGNLTANRGENGYRSNRYNGQSERSRSVSADRSSSYSRRPAGAGRGRGGGGYAQAGSRPVTRSQNHPRSNPSSSWK